MKRLLPLLVLLASCQATLSPMDEIRIRDQFERVYALTEIPRPLPDLRYNADPKWPIAAEADCNFWAVTLNYQFAAEYPEFVINKTIPHELAHILSCYERGSTDGGKGDSHDTYWRRAVIKLGGDPNYV